MNSNISSPTESEGVYANLGSNLIMSEAEPNPPEDIISIMLDDSINNLTLNSSVESKEACNLTEVAINSSTVNVSNKLTENKIEGSKGALNLTEEIIDSIIESHELVFMYFDEIMNRMYNTTYWQQAKSSFNEAADKIKLEFPQAGQIVLGIVDCDKQYSLDSRFWSIEDRPIFMLIRNGLREKRDYSGDKTVDAFVEYVRNELEDIVKEFKDINDLGTLDPEKRMYIGYFDSKNDPEYDTFRRAASNFKHYCQFRAGFGEVVAKMHPPGQPIVVLRPDVTLSNVEDETFSGSLLNFDEVYKWMCGNYVPLVRRTPINCNNHWDFVKEHLPIVILFHKPGDETSVRQFTDFCELHFMDLKNKILFLTSDSSEEEEYRPAISLHPKDKYASDIPMVLYQNGGICDTFLIEDFQNMKASDKLKQFIHDRFYYTPRESEAVLSLTHETIDSVIASNEMVFIIFYSGSSLIDLFIRLPKFNELAEQIKSEYPREGLIAFGKVDDNKERSLGRKYTPFNLHPPFFITVRHGRRTRHRFKFTRNENCMVDYIKKELECVTKEIEGVEADVGFFDQRKRMFIGYFDSKDSPEYEVFRRAASLFECECEFRAGFGEVVVGMHPPGQATLVLRSDVTLSSEHDETFNGSLLNFNEVFEWMSENYLPHLVRKIPITFFNHRDYPYEDLPLLVLFHEAGDEELIKQYTNTCESKLMHFKNKLVILTSDDKYFASCLIKIRGKLAKPVVPFIGLVERRCFHVDVFDNIQEMDVPGKLENFVINSAIYVIVFGFEESEDDPAEIFQSWTKWAQFD